MRRFVTFAVLLFFAIPFGISVSGCKHALAPTYCNGETSGVQVGQLTALDLEPRLTGISLNQGEMGRVNAPSGRDCRGDSAGTPGVVYASSNIGIADVAPNTGSLCAGSWNRNTGANIPDYTVCTPAAVNGIAYITASSSDVVSNPIPIFIHPVVTSIVLGRATTDCTNDPLGPGSDCVDLTQPTSCDSGKPNFGTVSISQSSLTAGVATFTFTLLSGSVPASGQLVTITGTTNAGGILNVISQPISSASVAGTTSASGATTGTFTVAGFPSTANASSAAENGQGATRVIVYDGSSCLSQGTAAQLVARTYTGNGTAAANNISCLVGPITFSAFNAAVLTVDANGQVTAAQPGSSAIGAATSQASSTAGFFNTCPPATITLSVPPNTAAPTAPISVNQNTAQPFLATVFDTNVSAGFPQGHPITNISLQYVSTNPTVIPTGGASVTPTYPGAAAITAICQPPTCNPSPFDEIGLFNNGTPVTSNSVQIAAAGTNFSTVLYIASKESQYLLPIDFTVNTQPSPVRLPYAPNSMVMSEDQSTLYMGTPYEIMTFSTASNALVKQDTSISGTVLAVSDDNSTIVITDPVRQLTYLYLAAGGVSSEYGGVATSAQFSTDSSTVYITTADGRLLVHSIFTGWSALPLTAPATDVAITVPNAGVYLAGSPVDVRTNCPATTIVNPGTGLGQTTTNLFFPDLGPVAGVNALSVAATNDGAHILSANTSSFIDIVTNPKSGNCPVTFTNTPGNPLSLAALGAISASNTVTPTYTPNQVTPNIITTSDSAFAFLSYQVAAPTGKTPGVVPQYAPSTGALTNLPLTTTANGIPTAPVMEVISADNSTLYVGTSGDNLVHVLKRGASVFTDTGTPIVPALPAINGNGNATPDLLAQRPRKATS